MDGYGSMLGAPAQMAPPAQPSAPTAAMPGGNMAQQPQDPLAFEIAQLILRTEAIFASCKQLAHNMAGDPDNAIKIEKTALELSKKILELKQISADRRKKISESMAAVQAAVLPPML